ncbi:HDOD domain-containing protein [Planosporangium thailandense]|uniref:HDOD domain-containing protein n=1 Tax=Planosporangium thailandense TaxID=765197 RepID=A0ABX0Y7R9_9ACTN|nr:HDOD domain-containing protein [Planosporangium thailandense]NJC73475.1 HDOD domain-containing protein [Planosporangium thailandense]
MTRARVLFVDDEPRILDGLRRSLHGKRGDWDMAFVTSGAEALDLLAESPRDVVVSDLRMPGMDGAELLTRVSERHPGVARVVVSGDAEREEALRGAVAGHRFLAKSAEADSIVAVIDQLAFMTSTTHRVEARRLAGAVRALPTLPGHADRLTALLGSAAIELSTAARAAARDVGLTAKLLQLSNSAVFGARARVASVENAIGVLGLPTLQALVDTGQLLWSSPQWGPAVVRELGVVWRHAMATTELVGLMASPANRPYAQAAASLQDVGRFVCLAAAGSGGNPDLDLAAADFRGVPYRDVGVELLHLWGLPYPIVVAVAERDLPQRPPASGLGVTAAVRAAHLLIQQTEARDPGARTAAEELAELLAHPQLTAQPVDWRRAAEEASARAGEWLIGDMGLNRADEKKRA